MEAPHFDWQGHRGARGLAPENTVAAFLTALKYPSITTLELDVVISGDSQVVVSHDPWMSPTICLQPGGEKIANRAEQHNLFEMPYAAIRGYDCGSKGHRQFPGQRTEPAVKPTLAEVVKEVDRYCRRTVRPLPKFNIELKAKPSWDDRYTPSPPAFAELVYREVRQLGIAGRSCLQSFDPRVLKLLHQTDSSLTLAYLLEFPFQMERVEEDLGFRPDVISPYYKLVSRGLVEQAHCQGMRIIPWTVNRTRQMEHLMEIGVDGIITDYPDRIPKSRPTFAKENEIN